MFKMALGSWPYSLKFLFELDLEEICETLNCEKAWWCWILLALLVCKDLDFSIESERQPCWYSCCRFCPFITLNVSCHSFLVCRVSVEISADSLVGVPLYVICHFSLVAFNILSLSFWQFYYYVLVCSSLGLSCLRFSELPGLGWLFPFPYSGIFQLLSLQIFSQVLVLFLLLLGPL